MTFPNSRSILLEDIDSHMNIILVHHVPFSRLIKLGTIHIIKTIGLDKMREALLHTKSILSLQG